MSELLSRQQTQLWNTSTIQGPLGLVSVWVWLQWIDPLHPVPAQFLLSVLFYRQQRTENEQFSFSAVLCLHGLCLRKAISVKRLVLRGSVRLLGDAAHDVFHWPESLGSCKQCLCWELFLTPCHLFYIKLGKYSPSSTAFWLKLEILVKFISVCLICHFCAADSLTRLMSCHILWLVTIPGTQKPLASTPVFTSGYAGRSQPLRWVPKHRKELLSYLLRLIRGWYVMMDLSASSLTFLEHAFLAEVTSVLLLAG